MRIAILITCHNRKAKTLACLDALFRNVLPEGLLLDVFLVDDGSVDGTARAVYERYPSVNIVHGDGNLYWNGGMRVAFAAAMKVGFDYYLWLNDDTTLYSEAIVSMLDTQQTMNSISGCYGIVVGSTQDDKGNISYGGLVKKSRYKPIGYKLINPTEQALPCLTMNGNCVLIAADAVKVLGNLDKNFVHNMGDIDYGLRAVSLGIPVWLMPGFAGICTHDHSALGSYRDGNLSFRKRLQLINAEKNLPSRAWKMFCRRHGGFYWLAYWLWPYLKVILRKDIVKLKEHSD